MDLIVDGTLDDTNRDLKAIKEEFDNIEKNAEQDWRTWGQRDLEKALHDFAHNWYVHRDAIQSRLSKLSERVDKAAQTWDEADKKLAESLSVENEGGR